MWRPKRQMDNMKKMVKLSLRKMNLSKRKEAWMTFLLTSSPKKTI